MCKWCWLIFGGAHGGALLLSCDAVGCGGGRSIGASLLGSVSESAGMVSCSAMGVFGGSHWQSWSHVPLVHRGWLGTRV